MPCYDFILIGGGPAGSATAALLAQRGFKVALCEQKAFPRPKVCGEFLSTRLRPVLRQLDLEADFDRLAGPPISRLLILPPRFPAPPRLSPGLRPGHPSGTTLAPRGGTLRHPPDGPRHTLHTPFAPDSEGFLPCTLARDQLDELLLRRAAQLGATLLQPCPVSSVAGSLTEGFLVATASHGILQARSVILAHGLAQRGDMNPAATRHPSPRTRTAFVCFKAHFTGCQLPEGTIALASAPGIYAGLVRTSDLGATPRYSLAFTLRRERIDSIGNSAASQLHDLLYHNPAFAELLAVGGPNGLAEAAPSSAWLASGPLLPGIHQTYRDGRFFVGNAAGEVHPLIGEGVTLALQSASLLADSLTSHGICSPAAVSPDALEAAGRAYSRQWRRNFLPRYHAANIFAAALLRPALARPVAALLQTVPSLLNVCLRAAGQSV